MNVRHRERRKGTQEQPRGRKLAHQKVKEMLKLSWGKWRGVGHGQIWDTGRWDREDVSIHKFPLVIPVHFL